MPSYVLDFDGTVIDTMPQLADLAIGLVVENTRLPRELAHAWYWQSIGDPIERQLERLLEPDDWRYWKILCEFERRRWPIYEDAKLYDDAVALLKQPCTRITSSTPGELVKRVLWRTGVDVAGFGLPKSVALRIARMGGPVTYVGDAVNDLTIAQTAGVAFVGVDRGWPFNEWPAGATIVSTLRELV